MTGTSRISIGRRLRALAINAVLVAASAAVGFVAMEVGYRGYLSFEARRAPYDSFAVYSSAFWSYDADFGFNYAPGGSADLSVLVLGQARNCLSFMADRDGNPGRARPVTKPQRRIFVFGDSMTFYHYDGDTWPGLLQDQLNAQGGRTQVVNFARDGTGVLQMFDAAATMVRRGERPDLIAIAFITDDLARRRFWRQSVTHPDGSADIFTSIDRGMSFAPGTYVRATIVHPSATRAWCEARRSLNAGDPTFTELRTAYRDASLSDAEQAGRAASMTSVDRSYLVDTVLHHDPYFRAHTAMTVLSGMSDFAADRQFVQATKTLAQSRIPVALVWLPQQEELASGTRKLTEQTRRLVNSLVHVSGFPLVDLLEPAPLDAQPYFNLPYDAHPSRRGLALYAQRLAEKLP